MSLPPYLTETVILPNVRYPVWQVRQISDDERVTLKLLLDDMLGRIAPADAAAVNGIIKSCAEPDGVIADALSDWGASVAGRYSETHLRAAIATCGGLHNLAAVTADMGRRCDNARVFIRRARILLGLQSPEWWEVPGGRPPEANDHAFDRPVFGGLRN